MRKYYICRAYIGGIIYLESFLDIVWIVILCIAWYSTGVLCNMSSVRAVASSTIILGMLLGLDKWSRLVHWNIVFFC